MRLMRFAVPMLLIMLAAACAPAGAPPTPTPPPKVAAPTATPIPKPTPTPAPPYYAGKTIRFIVGLAPGGGYDTYYRLIARYIGKHLPGNPSAIVENMVGGGSLIAANHLYKVAKPDGLTVGVFLTGLVLQQAMGGEGIEFDAKKFNWIGSPSPDTVVCILHRDLGFKTVQDFIASPKAVVMGSTGPGSQMWDYGRLLGATLGANTKVISGYGGTAPVRLAIERKEVDGACWGWESIRPTAADILATGLVIPIMSIMERPADLPNLPLAIDLAKTEEGRQLLRLRSVPDGINRALAAPPGVAPELVSLLRKAFMDTLKDPELLEEAKKAKLDINPQSGEKVEKLVAEMLATPPAVAKKLAEILKE